MKSKYVPSPCQILPLPTTAVVIRLLLTGLLASLWVMSTQAEEPLEELSFDHFFVDQPDGQRSLDPKWRPGTTELLYGWNDGEGFGYWLYDVEDGTTRLVVRRKVLVGDIRGRVTGLDFLPGGDRILFSLAGDLYLIDVESGNARRLTTTEAAEENATASPDGKQLAFVRDDELYVLDLVDGDERRLTHDGEPGVVFNGTTDWVYWEEIWGRSATGFWWSGDGRHIAFYHIDDREVPVFPLVNQKPVHPKTREQRYPKAGDPLPRVEIRVLDLERGEVRVLATGDDPDTYLARVHWHPDHRRLAVERLNREQTRLDVLLCKVADGSCAPLHTEEHPTWLNLGDEFTFLADGSFLWSSEKSGWKALYHHGAEGQETRRLTPEGWALSALELVDEAAGRFVYTAYSTGELGAAERHVFEGRLADGETTRLTERGGWNRVLASPSGHWLHTWSDANTPTELVVRRGTSEIHRLPAGPPRFDLEAMPKWEYFTIPGPEGSRLPAQLMKPAGFDAQKKYPVLTYHYGGPGSQVVDKRWSNRLRPLWHRLMAMRGYVVFAVDNQASSYFGKAGEDRLHRRFGEVELAGQLAGVEYLRSLPWVDAERIGIWGWSGGGTNTLYSLFKKPGVWAAGISGAPVTDWRLYDAIWTERYFDHPEDNEEGYRESSAIHHAAGLQDALLLIHGTGDDNVHAQNTLNLIDALVQAGARFDLALYPNKNHSWRSYGEPYQRHMLKTMTEFLDRHLRPENLEPLP